MSKNILLIGKIFLVFIVIYIVIAFLYVLFTILESYILKICKCSRTCLNQIFYKKATIIPIELAIVTQEPINSIATQIYTEKVSIISI
jgi:hypothetical protein